jgi:hypothetical protein
MRKFARPTFLFLAAVLVLRAAAAPAETYNVACSASLLQNVITETNLNGEEDFVWLAPSCVYLLGATWVVQPDAGNPVRVHGRAATLSGQGARTVLVVNAGATLELSGVTVKDGAATGSANGGAIRNAGTLVLNHGTVASSAAPSGGGIYNTGTARLVRSTVSQNVGSSAGGGAFNAASGRLTLFDSTFSGNSGLYGGGLGNYGSAALFNSTLFGNSGFVGGGILNEPAGRLGLSNVTISANSISGSDGGGGLRNEGALRIDNTIIANHPAPYRDCFNSGTMTAFTGNLIEDGTCPYVGVFAGDPKLAGPSGTPASFELQHGSPAIDAGQNPACTGLDQRGGRRPHDGNKDGYLICDLGAVEQGACGLFGIEGFALLPFVRWLRRRRAC